MYNIKLTLNFPDFKKNPIKPASSETYTGGTKISSCICSNKNKYNFQNETIYR